MRWLRRFNIVIIATSAVSNHHHSNLLGRDGWLPEFVHYFFALLARRQNCYRGRWENFRASGGASTIELVDPGDIVRALVYTLNSFVKDFLVEEVTQWPGVNSWSALRADRALTATRPQHFFRKRMPARLEPKMVVPAQAGVGTQADLVGRLGAQIATVEDACRQVRNTIGRSACCETCGEMDGSGKRCKSAAGLNVAASYMRGTQVADHQKS